MAQCFRLRVGVDAETILAIVAEHSRIAKLRIRTPCPTTGRSLYELRSAVAWLAYAIARRRTLEITRTLRVRTRAGVHHLLGLARKLRRDDPGFCGWLDMLADQVEAAVEPLLADDDTDLSKTLTAPVRVATVISRVARHCGRAPADIKGPMQWGELMKPRLVAMALARQTTGQSLPQVGRAFGGRNHATVLHAVRKVARWEALDPTFAGEMDWLRSRIRADEAAVRAAEAATVWTGVRALTSRDFVCEVRAC